MDTTRAQPTPPVAPPIYQLQQADQSPQDYRKEEPREALVEQEPEFGSATEPPADLGRVGTGSPQVSASINKQRWHMAYRTICEELGFKVLLDTRWY